MTFCVLPWVHMYVGAPGDVKLCCLHEHTLPDIGNVKSNTLEEIWKGDAYSVVRRDFINGVVRKECSTCHKIEKSGGKSYRQYSNERWSIDSAETVPEFKLKFLDIRFSNLCNLKCRTCSQSFSSNIMAENLGTNGNKQNIVIFPGKTENDILEQVYPHLPYLEKIYFAGGEPLIQTQHYAILERLIEIGNTDLEVVYNTNLTNVVYKNGSVLNLWQKFKNVNVGASIDAIGPAAGYWRHGSSWDKIISNWNQIEVTCPNVKLYVTCSVSWPNILNVLKLHRFCFDAGLVSHSSKFQMHPVFAPYPLTELPQWKKDSILIEINKYQTDNNTNEFSSIKSYLEIENEFDSNKFCESIKEIKRLDALRGENFLDYFPEYIDIMDT